VRVLLDESEHGRDAARPSRASRRRALPGSEK
jgi:hypothetical protein